jgi:MYXO-CTERM domain-containing protein
MATETTWKVLSGPAVTVAEGRGTSLELQTLATDFSGAGGQFVIEWGVDGGGSKQITDRRTIDVGVDPFVQLSVSSSPALHREESTMEFDVTLRNTTSCAVEGLSLSVPLSGASPVLDSVLFDGAKAAAHLEGTTLVLDGVRLSGDGTSHVRLAARAQMLASPSADPTASLNGFVISMRAPEIAPTASGCGCSTTPPGFWFVAAGLLVLARRRRRAE